MTLQKKIFTRMCLNNWGGISHQILQFHEYVNLFSGKSGSGKSTVMDAIQVILYGSLSSTFLNKAADDAKNRRSVLSYLRGEQKDGTANRGGMDFCSLIALEIEDKGTHVINCVGVAFEVHKGDSEIKKYHYFSHSGRIPEGGYLTADGLPYDYKALKKLIEERTVSPDNRGRAEVNRIYPSREAYLNTLYDAILGYIDGPRFITMEKSAIALKMSNGTGQFIRDYMFPKSTGETIEKISEQLGAYRDIKEKIADLKQRIDYLTQVRQEGQALLQTETESMRREALLRTVDITDLQHQITRKTAEQQLVQETLEALKAQQQILEQTRRDNNEKLVQARADLQASDLGSKEAYLNELKEHCRLLAANVEQWRHMIQGLRRWEEDEVITDYISNPLLNRIAEFCRGQVTIEQCQELRSRIEKEKEEVEAAYEDYLAEKRAAEQTLKEKQKLIDDIKNNRKSYRPVLTEAKNILSRKLSDRYGKPVKVHILADLFDIREEEWKNAIEGRLARLKCSLITEPAYAHDAAVILRDLKQFEEVDLIHSDAIVKSKPAAAEHSLYEAVTAREAYVDACLKRYLGHIIKCRSVEELEQVKDGVTPDCYSYSNFIFRHLKKKDYTDFACIGSKVSKAKLNEYELEAARLQEECRQLQHMTDRLKAVHGFECLNQDPEYIAGLSRADESLDRANEERQTLEQEIQVLRQGEYRILEERVKHLQAVCQECDRECTQMQEDILRQNSTLLTLESDLRTRREWLAEREAGFIPNAELTAEAEALLQRKGARAVKEEHTQLITRLKDQEQSQKEQLQRARLAYIKAYPNCGFEGTEKSNEAYERKLQEYLDDYEPKYQSEFEKQYDLIYESLRENVIATIHGDIKAARRHAADINRLLRETTFSDSTYQIKIEPAKNENGQFYEMLMAEELDSKNLNNGGYDGQLSLGEDTFYQKYEQKIKLLTEKFMPVRDGDIQRIEQKRQEMEQYADYRNYLSFSMYEQVTDESDRVIRENFVDDMAGRDSGGEGQNPKYVALLAGFAMLYMQQGKRDSKIRLVLLDEAFSKMDQERSAVCLTYARKMNLQLIVCVPDERLQSLIRNVDCVYGFRRQQNHISMMHIDKGAYLSLMEGRDEAETNEAENVSRADDFETMADS